MERKIIEELSLWKKDSNHKPLLLYGNKQVGKTYAALQFGEKEFDNISYVSCNDNKEVIELLKKEPTLDKLSLSLPSITKEEINKESTLIIFDDINDLSIVNSIKRLSKSINANNYYIIMITSNREKLLSFRGEEITVKLLAPIDFEEYLLIKKDKELLELIKKCFKSSRKMIYHAKAMELYEEFLMTGGYPEAVNCYLEKNSDKYLSMIHQKIIEIYQKEFLNTINLIDITRSIEVFKIMPYQLLKTNKKFQYNMIKQGARKKEYEESIKYLSNNNYLYKSHKVMDAKAPLSKHKEEESFKLYPNDTGMFFEMLHLNKVRLQETDEVKQTMYEISISTTLINSGYNLYYYQSEGKAEIAFLIQTREGQIIPIELVNKKLTKAKSLSLFMTKFNILDAIKIGEDNFSTKKGVKYIPVYAIFCLKDRV